MAASVRPFRRHLTRLGSVGVRLLFPPRCTACDGELPESGHDFPLCTQCRQTLGPEVWYGCPRCGSSLPDEEYVPIPCGLCRNTRLHFDAIFPLGSYADQLRDTVLRMKRRSGDSLSVAMGRLFTWRRGQLLTQWEADLVVPVPMHWSRRLRRGTNNPEVLAASLGGFLGIPARRHAVARRRNTLPQMDLSPRQRFQNVRGAFGIRRATGLRGRRVLLVDDILTTGATCSEVAKALKEAGASAVAVAVLARAQGPGST